jgi:hypothetical protein
VRTRPCLPRRSATHHRPSSWRMFPNVSRATSSRRRAARHMRPVNAAIQHIRSAFALIVEIGPTAGAEDADCLST